MKSFEREIFWGTVDTGGQTLAIVQKFAPGAAEPLKNPLHPQTNSR